MLEVIERGVSTDAHPVPLLFVHGAWHAAWCWDENFLEFFGANGYRALALSLRGHGASSSPKSLHRCSFADYVADIASVADSLPTRPVVIGHSAGGLLVQKYLESHQAPAGVLLASVPPRGSAGFLLRWLRRHPWQFARMVTRGTALPYITNPVAAREKFFSEHTPGADVVSYSQRLQEESARAGLDAVLLKPARPGRVTTPLLVLGGDADGSITHAEIHATARAYRTAAELFPTMGHDMMLEPGWGNVAQRIDTWLTARGL